MYRLADRWPHASRKRRPSARAADLRPRRRRGWAIRAGLATSERGETRLQGCPPETGSQVFRDTSGGGGGSTPAREKAGRRSRSRHVHLYGKLRIDLQATCTGLRTAGRTPREKGGRPLGLQIYGPGGGGVGPYVPASQPVNGGRPGCKDALPRQVRKYFVTLAVAAAGGMESGGGTGARRPGKDDAGRAAGGGHGRKRQGKIQA